MNRITTAFFVAPTLVALSFTLGAIIALPVMLGSAALFGVPLFIFMRKRGWLAWGHVMAAGILCSLPMIAFTALTSNSGAIGSSDIFFTALCLGSGAVTGLLFWWIGIFRNAEFPTVSRGPPWTMLLVIPLGFLVSQYLGMLRSTIVYGRVVQILREAEGADDALVLRLTSGRVVTVAISHPSNLKATIGACYYAYERRSMTLTGVAYSNLGPSTDQTCGKAWTPTSF